MSVQPSDLVEVRRTFRRGELQSTTFESGDGRLRAVVEAGSVVLERRFGRMGSPGGLRLGLDELLALEAACDAWEASRAAWAAFTHGPLGPLGARLGHVVVFVPPGEGASPVELGRVRVAPPPAIEGREFVGTEETRPLASSLPGGATAELVRVGELETPPEGLRVGLVYALPAGLTLHARRPEADLRRGDDCVVLEPNDGAFVRELRAVVARRRERDG